jgi:hypothetical protein
LVIQYNADKNGIISNNLVDNFSFFIRGFCT